MICTFCHGALRRNERFGLNDSSDHVGHRWRSLKGTFFAGPQEQHAFKLQSRRMSLEHQKAAFIQDLHALLEPQSLAELLHQHVERNRFLWHCLLLLAWFICLPAGTARVFSGSRQSKLGNLRPSNGPVAQNDLRTLLREQILESRRRFSK